KKKLSCSCSFHETWKNFTVENGVMHIIKSKVDVKVVRFLVDHRFLTDRESYLCEACIAKTKCIISSSDKISHHQHLHVAVTSFTDSLKAFSTDVATVDDTVWEECFKTLGKLVLHPRIRKHGTVLCQKYNIKYLQTMKPENDIGSYDSFLLALLVGLSKRDISAERKAQVKYQVIMIMETIFSLCNLKWIFPYHFAANVVQSFISGSKIVTVLNGKLTPGGGYTTYLTWLKGFGKLPITCIIGEIITFIDNIGRYIIKNYRVTKDKVGAADVITTTLHILLNTTQSLQTNASYKPNLWGISLSMQQKQEMMEVFITNTCIIFRRCRYNYLHQMIELFKQDDDKVVSARVSQLMSTHTRVCTNENCKALYGPRKRKCDKCSSEVKRIEETKEKREQQTTSEGGKYLPLGETQNINTCPMKVGEPILFNPNSYENLELILKQLKENLAIGRGREWTFVGCDGPPYCLANRLIDRNPKAYDWLAMQPGLGHLI
uniref:Uncharacterized protein n=2 Tax=Clytia hemisphaerica TaxID=252671 RepID=A0A7M5WMT3_9CNID